MRKIWAMLCVVMGVSGCGDPQAATEHNFAIAIQAYLDSIYPKCYLYASFPVTVDWEVGGLRQRLRALAAAGVLSETRHTTSIATLDGQRKATDAPTFELTGLGRQYYRPDAIRTPGGKAVGGLCVGRAQVAGIKQFSEPSELYGQRVSQVNYTYVVRDFPTWTQHPAVQAQFRELQVDQASERRPLQALDVLVLTNKGWMHQALFRR